MKLNNAIIYRIAPSAVLAGLADSLAKLAFLDCGPSQEKSIGFVPPRAAEGAFAELVGEHHVMKFCVETRSVPAAAVRRKLDERCAEAEKTTGRKPGKKERRDMKDDIRHEMLPMAFTKRAHVNIWIDGPQRMLAIDVTSTSRADDVITALVQCIEGLEAAQINTAAEPSGAMAGWLVSQEPPPGFTIDRECELKATDESKSVVRYAKHALDIEEVRQHIASGKRPTRLAMTWEDRVSFELTQGMALRKITFLDSTDGALDGKAAANFDADVAIFTGELRQMVGALLEALGGEAVFKAALETEEQAA